jgi:hypothetical protein
MSATDTSPNSSLTKGPGSGRQLRFDVAHLVAHPLPDEIKVFDFVAGLRMQDDPALFRIRPHIVNFRQRAHLRLELARDQLFDIGRFHAGKKRQR